MHYALNDIFRVHIDKHYENVVSVVFLILLFYGGRSIQDALRTRMENSRVKTQLSGLIRDVAHMIGKEEADVKRLLDDRYGKVKLKTLVDATHRFLAPSKNQGNAPIKVNNYPISHDVVAEFPTRVQVKSDEPETSSYPMENVEIELHAQDVDHEKQGWAAVIPKLSPLRINMHLYPPIKPSKIYTRTNIRGDVFVETKLNKYGEKQPVRVHLVRLLG